MLGSPSPTFREDLPVDQPLSSRGFWDPSQHHAPNTVARPVVPKGRSLMPPEDMIRKAPLGVHVPEHPHFWDGPLTTAFLIICVFVLTVWWAFEAVFVFGGLTVSRGGASQPPPPSLTPCGSLRRWRPQTQMVCAHEERAMYISGSLGHHQPQWVHTMWADGPEGSGKPTPGHISKRTEGWGSKRGLHTRVQRSVGPVGPEVETSQVSVHQRKEPWCAPSLQCCWAAERKEISSRAVTQMNLEAQAVEHLTLDISSDHGLRS